MTRNRLGLSILGVLLALIGIGALSNIAIAQSAGEPANLTALTHQPEALWARVAAALAPNRANHLPLDATASELAEQDISSAADPGNPGEMAETTLLAAQRTTAAPTSVVTSTSSAPSPAVGTPTAFASLTTVVTMGTPTTAPAASTTPTATGGQAGAPSSSSSSPVLAALGSASRIAYAPRVTRANSGRVVIQSAHSAAASVTVLTRDEGGREIGRQSVTIPPFGQAVLRATELLGTTGSAGTVTLSSDGDITAAVEEQGPNSQSLTYDAVAHLSNVSAFPLVSKSSAGGTLLSLQNVSDKAAEISLTFTPSSGTAITGPTVRLAPFAAQTLNLADLTEVPAGFVGSALARANQTAIAGVAIDLRSDRLAAYSGFGEGKEQLLLPSALGAGGTTRVAGYQIAVQNLGSGGADVTTERVKRNDNSPANPTSARRNLAVGSATILDEPTASTDSAGVRVSGPTGAKLVALVQVDNQLRKVVTAERGMLMVPLVSSSNSLALQNLSGDPAKVAIQLMDADGVARASQRLDLEPGAATRADLSQLRLPSGFSGTALVASDQPLAVVAR